MRIGIQGEQGSYHHIVAKKIYESEDIIVPSENFSELFNELLSEKIDIAIVALANSIYGFVTDSFREIMKYSKDICIVGEYYLPIHHQLMVKKGTSLDSITEVISQSVALGQCKTFLGNNLAKAKLTESNDTASSARLVARGEIVNIAAIASKEAAQLHDLEIVAKDIQDNDQNTTRFLIIKKSGSDSYKKDNNKVTATLRTGQKVGSLANALNIFKLYDINITSLHSSYLENTRFEMEFFIEFEFNNTNIKLSDLTKELKEVDSELNILGSYVGQIHE